jgi:hypothetical protein
MGVVASLSFRESLTGGGASLSAKCGMECLPLMASNS